MRYVLVVTTPDSGDHDDDAAQELVEHFAAIVNDHTMYSAEVEVLKDPPTE